MTETVINCVYIVDRRSFVTQPEKQIYLKAVTYGELLENTEAKIVND